MSTAVFIIKDLATGKAIYIRHRCISCVRELAVTSSPAEEFKLWSDRKRSIVSLPAALPSDLKDNGKTGILLRVEGHGQN